jgi:hypothetical protein
MREDRGMEALADSSAAEPAARFAEVRLDISRHHETDGSLDRCKKVQPTSASPIEQNGDTTRS